MSSRIQLSVPNSTPSQFGQPRTFVSARAALLAMALLTASCASTPGEKILGLTEGELTRDESKVLLKAKSLTTELLKHLDIPTKQKSAFEAISLKRVIRADQFARLPTVHDTLVIAGGDIDIAFAKNSLVVARGVTHISHSSNNIVVAANNIDVSHDGSDGSGSLLIAKGKIEVSHARNSIVSSPIGVNVSHANSVVAYNTPDRKTSWGEIDNRIVRPIFTERSTLKGADTTPSRTVDVASSTTPTSTMNLVRTPKWETAEVHMVCLYESRSRIVVVEVLQTQKPVILVLCAYEDIVWDVRANEGSELIQVIASGYHQQRVERAAAPVATYSYDEKSPFYFYAYTKKMPTDKEVVEKVRQLTGKDILSYQGRYSYDNTPFVVGAKGIKGNVCQATMFEIAGLSIFIDCAELQNQTANVVDPDNKLEAENKEIRSYVASVNEHADNPGTRLTVVFRTTDYRGQATSDSEPTCPLLLDVFSARFGKAQQTYSDTEGGNNDWYYLWKQDNASLRLACVGSEDKRRARYAEVLLERK